MPETIALLKDALETFVRVCKGPLPSDYYVATHWGMAGAHAFIANGLISLYEQAPHVPAEKQLDFIGYALQWTAALRFHYETEEKHYLPMFEPKFDTSYAEREHATFTPGVDELEAYLVSCLPAGTEYGHGSMVGPHDIQPYDGARVCAIVDSFVTALCAHLVQEVTYLEPEKLIASGLTEADMRNIAEVSQAFSKTLPLTTLVTYACLLAPKGVEFPPLHSIIRSYFFPKVLSFANRRYWQFAPKSKSWTLF